MTLARKFKALGDPTRLRIVNLLLHSELCVCDIQQVLGLTQSRVSQHLSYLKGAGLVSDNRRGYRVFYSLLQDESIAGLVGLLRGVLQQEVALADDVRALKEAIEDGACQFVQLDALRFTRSAPNRSTAGAALRSEGREEGRLQRLDG